MSRFVSIDEVLIDMISNEMMAALKRMCMVRLVGGINISGKEIV